MLDGRNVVSVLDAKYRDLWEHPLPPGMLYQLAVYAMSQIRCTTASILFPTVCDDAVESRIAIRDPVSGNTRAHVTLRPVHMNRLADLVARADCQAARRARAEFAKCMAFGHSGRSRQIA